VCFTTGLKPDDGADLGHSSMMLLTQDRDGKVLNDQSLNLGASHATPVSQMNTFEHTCR
jgi:hypothetical protein